MGQQLVPNAVFLIKAKKPKYDVLRPEGLLTAATMKLPLFYFWTENEVVHQDLDTCRTLAENMPEATIQHESPPVDDKITAEIVYAIADHDIDWLEYDHLEAEFKLHELRNKTGHTIVVLKTSVFLIDYSYPSAEDECQILQGFDLKATNIPKDVIHCHGQSPS